jgi:hypothetical protein
MNETSKAVEQLKKLGFNVEDTGGGCQWLRKSVGNNLSICITNGQAELPDNESFMFLAHAESSSNPIMETSLMKTSELIDRLNGFGG